MLYRFGNAEIDTATREIRRAGVTEIVEPKVFDFVAYLIRHRDRVVEKQELLDELWGGRAVGDSVIARAAHAARRLLADPAAIKTLYGKGYRFIAPLNEHDPRSANESAPPANVALARLTDGTDLAYIGRRTEMGVAGACLERVMLGEPRTLIVTGDPGIGKTALCERVAKLTQARGGCTLWGKCSEVPGAPAYWPFIQLLRELTAAPAHAAVEGLVAKHPEVAELVSARTVDLQSPGGEKEHARFRLFDAIGSFLRGAARLKPFTLLLDDVHCADMPSLLLLRFLVQHLSDARILVVVAYRDAEMRAGVERARWARDLVRLSGVVVCRLGGLERDEVSDFVQRSTGDAPSTADLSFLVAQTAGNPFYLSQLTPLLGRVPSHSSTGSAKGPEAPLPRSVLDAIESHLSGISAESRTALEGAAVLGRDFELGMLSLVLEAEKPDVLELLAVPLDAGILEERSTGSFRFAHVLIRDALYRGLQAQVRSELHRRAGEALERTSSTKNDSVASSLAHHFTEVATTASAPKAIQYRGLSGALALKRLAYEEAAVQLVIAIRLHDETRAVDDPALCELLLKLGAAQTRSGNREAAGETFRRAASVARKLQMPTRLAEVALDLAPGFLSLDTGVVDVYLIERLEEALLALGDAQPLLRARLLARLAMALCWTGQAERRAALCDEVAALARTTQNPETRLRELNARHAALWTPDNLAERLAWANEAVALGERLGDLDGEFVARCFQVVDLLQAGEIARVREAVATFKDVAIATQQPECLWLVGLYDTMFALLRGEYARVERFGLESIAIGQRLRHHDADLCGAVYVAFACMETGRAAEVLPKLEEYMERDSNVPWAPMLAFVLSRTGDRAATRRAFDRAISMALSYPRDNVWFATMAELCEAAFFLGASEEAVMLHAALAPFAGMQAVIGYGAATYGAVDRYLGQASFVLENWSDAIGEIEAGIEHNRMMGAEPFVAHGSRELSMALRKRGKPGDLPRADQLVLEATAIAERLQMKWLLARLQEGSAP